MGKHAKPEASFVPNDLTTFLPVLREDPVGVRTDEYLRMWDTTSERLPPQRGRVATESRRIWGDAPVEPVGTLQRILDAVHTVFHR